jgi:hypothetical protein
MPLDEALLAQIRPPWLTCVAVVANLKRSDTIQTDSLQWLLTG